jgi:hypothetical protein
MSRAHYLLFALPTLLYMILEATVVRAVFYFEWPNVAEQCGVSLRVGREVSC